MDVPNQANQSDASPNTTNPVLANKTGTSGLAVSSDQTDSIIPAFQEAYGARSDGLPNYTEIEQDGSIQSTIQELSAAASAGGLELPITAYPPSHGHRYIFPVDRTHNLRQDIVRSFFNAITTKKDEAVALMIEHNLVTANTTDATGQTPLLAAVSVGNVRMVQELVDLDADVNGYGVYTEGKYGQRGGGKPRTSHRTALQLAAALGNLNLVKLFVDAYGADDALVAPDGELALRLAADNGHREIVDFLPLRRGGGWRRWKTRHAKAMDRARRAAEKIYHFGRFFVWEVPRFFLWTVPKECAKAIKYAAVWAWKRRKQFGGWCKRQVTELPGRVARALRAVWTLVKAIPKAVQHGAVRLWGVVKGIPTALKIAARWLWSGLKTVGHGIASIIGRLFSLLHTVFSKVLLFFRNLTLKDVWNGFRALLHTMLVEVPLKLWSWVKQFGEVSGKVLVALFGTLGLILQGIMKGILLLIVYVPKKTLVILSSFGESISKAWVELLVWINPKR